MNSEMPQESIQPEPYSSDQPFDALSYLKAVQTETAEDPEIFYQFLEVLRVYREDEQADMKNIAQRIVMILHKFPALVVGFNSFLPEGNSIRVQDDKYVISDQNEDIVVDPNQIQKPLYSVDFLLQRDESVYIPPAELPPTKEDALSFLKLCKDRFEEASKPQLYKTLKDLIKKRREVSNKKTIEEVVQLLQEFPDLLFAFNKFLPRAEQLVPQIPQFGFYPEYEEQEGAANVANALLSLVDSQQQQPQQQSQSQ